MRPHALNRGIASRHLSDDSIVIVRIKPSPIPHLPARLCIKRRVIKNHFTRFASRKFLHALPITNNRQYLAAIRASLSIAFELRLRKLLINRISRLLRRAPPRGASPRLLLFHRAIEGAFVEADSVVPAGVFDKVPRKAVRVIQYESLVPWVDRYPTGDEGFSNVE